MSTDQDNSRDGGSGKLTDAVRKARIAEADRTDVVVELREATRTRLELLAQDLQPVIDEVPDDDDRFDFALSNGLQPRFWIDATAHVMMAQDRRTYRFVRDTRLGRSLLGESADRKEIAERVTTYIATRIHERELEMAGDMVSYRGRKAREEAETGTPREQIEKAVAELRAREQDLKKSPPKPTSAASTEEIVSRAIEKEREARAEALLRGLLLALLGAVLGAGMMLLAYRDVLFRL